MSFSLQLLSNDRVKTKPRPKPIVEPFLKLTLFSQLFLLTIYMSLVYGILYPIFEAFPISFGQERGWIPVISTLPFIGIFIGVVLACFMIVVFSKTYNAKRLLVRGRICPEDRLLTMMLGAVLLPLGMCSTSSFSHSLPFLFVALLLIPPLVPLPHKTLAPTPD